MTVITNTWRQLVQRRLWPVALLLVGALAAVPLALAKQPAEAPAASASPGANDDGGELASAPIVTAADEAAGGRRHVLGNAKNPFAIKARPRAVTSTVSVAPGSTVPRTTVSMGGTGVDGLSSSPKLSTVGSTGGLSTSTGSTGSTGSIGVPPSSTGVTPPSPQKAPKPRYPLYSIDVRFGDTSSDQMDARTVERLEPLPDADTPVAIYLGVKDDGKTAVFLLDDGVTAEGDGRCAPSANDCETILLHAGETEFLDVPGTDSSQDKQYELDLVRIHRRTTASAARAKKARAASSAAGRKLLRARASHVALPFRYDAATGTVHAVTSTVHRLAHAALDALVPHFVREHL